MVELPPNWFRVVDLAPNVEAYAFGTDHWLGPELAPRVILEPANEALGETGRRWVGFRAGKAMSDIRDHGSLERAIEYAMQESG